MSERKIELPTALRENSYMFVAISLIIVGALWKIVDWSIILSIEFAIFTFVFSGWIKKWKDAALIEAKSLLGLKEDEILKLKENVSEFKSKNKILEDIINKLSKTNIVETISNVVDGVTDLIKPDNK